MSGIDTLANTLFTSLQAGAPTVSIDNPDLTQPQWSLPSDATGPFSVVPTQLTDQSLTSGSVEGGGTFDVLMAGIAAQLWQEYEKGRISGAEYARVYMSAVEQAVGASVQWLLGRDQAYWNTLLVQQQALAAQAAAITAQVQLEAAKAQYRTAVFEGMTAEANFALIKAKLSTESVAYDTASFQLSNILPIQEQLVTEQVNSQKAQTSSTRYSDGAQVAGLLGAQVSLYGQQVISYQRDAQVKVAKLFSDAFNTQVTVTSGLTPPNNFTDASLDTLLTNLRTPVGL